MKNFNFTKHILKENYPIKKAIAILNKLPNKFCLVVNRKNKFIGTITDGDIRRGVLKNFTVNDEIKKFYNSKSFFLTRKISSERALYIMNLKKISFLPQINKLKKVVKVYLKNSFEDEVKNLPNKMIIMAGGKGKRLWPLTKKIPKPLLTVNGKPIIEKIILQAKKQGIKKFIISINYLGHKIVKYLNNGSKLGVQIEYIKENKPLGTAGSLFFLKNINKPFIVSNADIVSDINYKEMIKYHNKLKSCLTIGSINTLEKNLYGRVVFKNKKVLKIEEKIEKRFFINAGIYVLNPDTKKFLEKDKYCDMTSLIEKLIKKKMNVNLFPIHEKWHDYGIKNKHQNV